MWKNISFYEQLAEKNELIFNVNKLRKNSNSFKIGYVKHEPNSSLANPCEYIEFQRYFDAETTYSIHFDLDAVNYLNCKSIKATLQSNNIKNIKANIEFMHSAYVNEDELNLVGKLEKLKTISFNSAGKTTVKLPHNLFLILSWPFKAKDLKDIL
jgi:hypothetical protein